MKPPQEHPGWSYVRSGNVFGAPCVQAIKRGLIIGNEDCLTLNIASHISSRDKLLPVMVFIHGGYVIFPENLVRFAEKREISSVDRIA